MVLRLLLFIGLGLLGEKEKTIASTKDKRPMGH
jgi:hypothetical protein